MAAKKNPKRVAAGKKAWRNRGKAKSRSGGGSGGSNRRKPIQRGVSGKVGAFLLGVAPPAIAGVEAAQAAAARYNEKNENLSVLGTAFYGFTRFLNNMGQGMLGYEPFNDKMSFAKKDGGTWVATGGPKSGVPKGSLLGVAATGLAMMAFDYIASKLAGGRPVKILGTNYNATGGS